MSSTPTSGLQLRSTVSESGTLELTLVEVPVPAPNENDVVIRVEASPINPSDLGLLLAAADVSKAQASERDGFPVVSAPIDPTFLRSLSARLGESMAVGNEGAGTVISAGSSPAAQALLGKTVSAAGGQMYSQYRKVDVSLCL